MSATEAYLNTWNEVRALFQTKFESLKSEHADYSIAQMARKFNVPRGLLYLLDKNEPLRTGGKSAGHVEYTVEKLNEAKRKLSLGLAAVATTHFKRITQICQAALQRQDMHLIAAPTRMGKTFALDRFVEKTPKAFIVHCLAEWRKKDLLKAVALALGAVLPERVTDAKLLEIILERAEVIEEPLLILDEASQLKPAAFSVLHSLYNLRCMGIVVAGTPEWHAKLKRQSGIEGNKPTRGIPELYARFDLNLHLLSKLEAEDIHTFCQARGLIDKNCIQFLVKHANNYQLLDKALTHLTLMEAGHIPAIELLKSFFNQL